MTDDVSDRLPLASRLVNAFRPVDLVLVGVGLILAAILADVAAHASYHLWRTAAKYPVSATIWVFILTQLLTMGWKLRDERLFRRRVIDGLHDEISRNLIEQERDRLNAELIDIMKEFVGRAELGRPVFVLAFQDGFYKGIVKDLPVISSAQLRAVNEFYFRMSQAKAAADSLERPSFVTISTVGKHGVLDYLLKAYNEAVTSGEQAIKMLKPERH